MNVLRSALAAGDGVADGLAGRLDGEGDLAVSDGEPLSVHRARGHAPEGGVEPLQLGDVGGYLQTSGDLVGKGEQAKVVDGVDELAVWKTSQSCISIIFLVGTLIRIVFIVVYDCRNAPVADPEVRLGEA